MSAAVPLAPFGGSGDGTQPDARRLAAQIAESVCTVPIPRPPPCGRPLAVHVELMTRLRQKQSRDWFPASVQPAAATANASRAAASVASSTPWSWALERKPASYADGARNTPRSSMAWKKRLNAAVSQAVAWA